MNYEGNELEKCLNGEYYDCHDKVFLNLKTRARKLLKEYHALARSEERRVGKECT